MGKRIKIKKTEGGSIISIDTSLMYQPKYVFLAGWATGILTTYVLKKINRYMAEKIVNRIWSKKKKD